MERIDQRIPITINGRQNQAIAGQTVAAALLAAGIRAFRQTPNGVPRGIFCGMGVCFDCLVTIDEIPNRRACIELVHPEMEICTHPHE